MSSSANSVDTDSSSLSRQDNKRAYSPDSPPPVLEQQNKRQRVSLDSSSAADDRVQLPPIHSLRDHHHLSDSRRASLPTLHSDNPVRLSKSYPSNGAAPVRSAYNNSPSLSSYQFPPTAHDQEDKFRPRPDTCLSSSQSFNPYTSYSNSSTPNSSFPSSFNFASPVSPPSQSGHPPTNGYTHSWSAPSPHLTRPSSNPESDRHPATKSDDQLDSWPFSQYSQSNSLNNGPKQHPTSLNPVSSLPAPAAAMAERPKGKRGKLPKPVTDYLKDWLHRHSDHPYPSEDEKKQLCQATGLSMSQVSNWMINVSLSLPPTFYFASCLTFPLSRLAVGFSHQLSAHKQM